MVLPLRRIRKHVFLETDGGLWILDTGSNRNIGDRPTVRMNGREYPALREYAGLTAESLNTYVGVPLKGIVGHDLMGGYDWIWRLAREEAEFSETPLAVDGARVPYQDWHSLPLVRASISGREYLWVFDTGAPISYLQDPVLRQTFPYEGVYNDFFPAGVGRFSTQTARVPFVIGGVTIPMRTGTLPANVEPFITKTGAIGIIGNEVLVGREVGYFPRRHELVLGRGVSAHVGSRGTGSGTPIALGQRAGRG